MGTLTDFRGAIRIVPMVPEQLAERMNLFFGIRHMRRDTKALDALYPTEEVRRAHSLFDDGDFGTEGAFYLPDQTREVKPSVFAQNPVPEGLREHDDMNTPPGPLPSIYSHLEIVSDNQFDCSYLGWSGEQDAFGVAAWITYFTKLLMAKGYQLDGKIIANVEDGAECYSLTVNGGEVVVEDLVPDYTYNQKFEFAER